jgi:AhpD family alkylhydroperoxidase
MTTSYRDLRREVAAQGREVRAQVPAVYKGFAELSGAALGDGALDRKTKELMALAISIVQHCDGCIAAHASGAASAGATEAEVAESIGVAILMAGGPATVWGPRAMSAFKEFAAPAAPTAPLAPPPPST